MIRLIAFALAFLVGTTVVMLMLRQPVADPDVIPANGARYRVSVEMVVGQKTVVTSAVQQIELRSSGIFTGFGGTPAANIDHHGEAPFVQLPSGVILAALMLNPSVDGYTRMLWSACGIRTDRPTDDFITAVHTFSGTCELPKKLFPVLASISDPADAGTMTILRDGTDAKITRTWIETTREPITREIQSKLLFLSDPKLGSKLIDYYPRYRLPIGSTSFWRS